MAVKPETKKTLLGAIRLNARSVRDSQATLANLIARAVERGIAQMEVAEAAGVSQAHVSRTLAAYRKQNDARKAARASKRSREGGTV